MGGAGGRGGGGASGGVTRVSGGRLEKLMPFVLSSDSSCVIRCCCSSACVCVCVCVITN